MPLPKPKDKEKRSEFVSRCVSEVAKDPKFKDNKQRVAICYTQFEEAKKEAQAVVSIANKDEFLVFAAQKTIKAEEPMSKEESTMHEADPKDMEEDSQEEKCDCEEGEKCEKCMKEEEANYKDKSEKMPKKSSNSY